MERHPDDLDRIDRKILAILQEDGRISNLKLAESVNPPPATCSSSASDSSALPAAGGRVT